MFLGGDMIYYAMPHVIFFFYYFFLLFVFFCSLAKDPDKRGTLLKIEQEVSAINQLLDRFERYVGEQRGLLKHLKV